MFKGRGLLVIIILIVLAAAIYLLLRPGGFGPLRRNEEDDIPLDLRNVIPADWDVVSEWQRQCDFDDDGENEWLIVYNYDQTKVAQPYTEAAEVDRGPIGAAIFDTQNNVLPEDIGNPSPYAPTFVIPYRLLPDFYEGKGQGYLGETKVEVIFNPPLPREGDCKVTELTILGYADGPLPTRISIFRWQSEAIGYIGAHYTGDAHVAADVPVNGPGAVTEVTTYNRLANHRSLLCAVRRFNRSDENTVTFNENLSVFSVDFCFGAPPDPAYPEGVIVAHLRGGNPLKRTAQSSPPDTNNFLLMNASVPAEIQPAATTRIVSLTNPASVNRDPAGGHACTTAEIKTGVGADTTPGPTPTTPASTGYTCGRETATVETEIVSSDRVSRVVWQLISIIPEKVNGDVYWRIQSAQIMAEP